MNPYSMFELECSKFDARISELNEELTLAEDELRELKQEREAVLRNVMKNGDVSKIESRIEAAIKRFSQLQERIRYAEEAKQQRLATMLDEVETQRHSAVERKRVEYQDAIRTLNRKKLEYLTYAARIGELAREIDGINNSSNDCRRAAGEEPLRHWPTRSEMTLNANPALHGFDRASWESLAVDPWLIKAAVDEKKLPAWRVEVMPDGK